uniref:Uncharacterized protein n=1 Tax=Anguilla anguilla TaxID=7936 RepID=A0A0E9TV41_ANGAN
MTLRSYVFNNLRDKSCSKRIFPYFCTMESHLFEIHLLIHSHSSNIVGHILAYTVHIFNQKHREHEPGIWISS